jgi:hypothetical protein
MDRDEALRIVDESLSRTVPGAYVRRSDTHTYFGELKARLRALVIDPIPVTAVASDYAQKWLNRPNTIRPMVALARSERQWLLYDEQARVFEVAHGDPAYGPLSLLGFEEEEALDAWLA